MNDKRHQSTPADHDTVLAHINDPAPTTAEKPEGVESAEESDKQAPHERIDDRTVLAKINGDD